MPRSLKHASAIPKGDEAAFLALTRRMGIDWTATVGDLKARYGTRRWFGFKDVIDVPLGSLTRRISGTFCVDYRLEDEPWPPGEYCKEIIAEADVARQHRNLAAALTRLLGPGTKHPAVNVIGATWRIGVFSVEIMTFLKERRPLNNPLYERHPELWNKTDITVKADHYSFAPDEALAPVADEAVLMTVALGTGLDPVGWFPPLIRRNPAVLRALVPEGAIAVRTDPATGMVVVSGHDLSLAFERAACERVNLWRAVPARGSGYATLDIDYRPPVAPRQTRSLRILTGDGTASLDAVASQLARALDLSLATQHGNDD